MFPTDPNASQGIGTLWQRHTEGPTCYRALVIRTNRYSHTIDVRLLSAVDNRGKPLEFHHIRVGVEYGGNGWGEFNLPHVGQEVELKFENGITTTPQKATITKRFYNNQFKPPSHDLLNKDDGYEQSYWRSTPGGSFSMLMADGSTNTYNIKPASFEGAQDKKRVTGVPQTQTEVLANRALKGVEDAQKKLTKVKSTAQTIARLGKKVDNLRKASEFLIKQATPRG